MVLSINSKLNVRATGIFTLLLAMIFTHLDLLINGLPHQYFFPFAAFTINVFYTALGLYLFWEITLLLDNVAWLKDNRLVKTSFLLLISLGCYCLLQCAIVYYFEPTFNQNYLSTSQMSLTFGFGILVVCLINGFLFLQQPQKLAITTQKNQVKKNLSIQLVPLLGAHR